MLQLLYLLDTVKNGIKQQNLRVPFVMTTYVAKVAQQMLRPGGYITQKAELLQLVPVLIHTDGKCFTLSQYLSVMLYMYVY